MGSLEGVIEALRHEIRVRPSAVAHGSLLYTLHYHPGHGPDALFAEHRAWDQIYGGRHPRPAVAYSDRIGKTRLRVGYLSPDLRDHTVPRFLGHAIEYRDREALEVVCYSDSKRADATTAWIRERVDLWRETAALTDEQLEQLIRDDRIDVLVDLRGHGADNRLPVFARKPAPVQVNMIGYFDTTGLEAMDWRVTDERLDPTGISEAFHTEKLARLPNGCWCYRADTSSPPVADLPADRTRRITFGSLNKFIKINPELASLWRQILDRTP